MKVINKPEELQKVIEESKAEYNIYAIDYFANGREMPKAIYVNYGCMGLFFDRHSRRIVKVD